jgi:hypothetical protein
MKHWESGSEPELEALLNPRRIERVAPPEVRARALARARAIIAAGGRIPPRSSLELVAAPLMSIRPAPGRGSLRLVLPASLAAAAVAIGATVAVRSPPPRTPALSASARQPAAASVQVEEPSAPEQTVTPELVTPAKPAPTAARPEREVGASELELLGRAQAAYAHRDFARALNLVGELTRRFPNGHLAEEREALRVRSLSAMGSTDEGRRAAAAFANRFPRSVLLPKDSKP